MTVLEADEPGSGASSRSFAWINGTSKTPLAYHNFSRRSVEMWDRFSRSLDEDVGLRWGGQVRWVSDMEAAENLRQEASRLQGWGYPIRSISKSKLAELEPDLNIGDFAAAMLSEMDGQVEPLKVIDVCLRAAVSMGAELHTHTRVTGLSLDVDQKEHRYVKSVETSKGDISCDVLVLAAGVGSTELGAMANIPVHQEESPGVMVHTSPLPPLFSNIVVLYTPPDRIRSEIHIRQNIDGTVLIGEGRQESLRRDDSQQHADDLLSRASAFLPAIGNATAFPLPVGYRPMPEDGYPVLGFPQGVPNMYIALTHSGVTLAPLIGQIAALEIIDGARIEGLEPYRPERFAVQR